MVFGKKRPYLKGSLDKYLKGLSGKTITPGGGSAAALAAAIGAGLNLMVISYSGIVSAEARQRESLHKLSGMIDEDCKVFEALMDALSSKKDAQKEFKEAAKVPMNICRECHVSMDITAFLAQKGNKNLVTDVGCAADILRAAFNSAALNVKVNLARIEDELFVAGAEKTLLTMKKDIDSQFSEISCSVTDSMKKKEAK
ncbi:MAG: cyclodeaminase/cyclohydrolase family protein [Candidatus Omnitrophota bacterium]